MANRAFAAKKLTDAVIWTVRHKSLGSVILSTIDPFLKLIVRFSRWKSLPRLRQDEFFMLRALLFSALRIEASEKMMNLLKTLLGLEYPPDLKDVPVFMVISPGKMCNLQCPDCYANSATERNILDYEVLSRIVAEAKRFWRMRFFVISGGEPFIYKNNGKGILDLAEENLDSLFLVFTNGTMIDRDYAKRMAELANITPAISVEGMRETTDKRRGKGIFDKTLEAMENLRNARVPFGLSITATRHNAHEILSDQFIEFFFYKQKVAYAWIFQYMPIGRNPNPQLIPTPEQRIEMWHRSWQIIKQKKIMIADFWNQGTVSQGCLAGGRQGGYFHIDWNGDVSPCVFFPYHNTNIYEVYKNGKCIKDVLSTPLFQKVRQWQEEYGLNQKFLTSKTDWLRPCPIRDHYEEATKIIHFAQAKGTDFSPDSTVNASSYYNKMVEYDKILEKITRKIWESQYLRTKSLS
ncbi:MAG: radical SAM protein [candidate division WOR-3 bacterium]|nr:radical SAM protein [candidate division WOR-3 bacterium]